MNKMTRDKKNKLVIGLFGFGILYIDGRDVCYAGIAWDQSGVDGSGGVYCQPVYLAVR